MSYETMWPNIVICTHMYMYMYIYIYIYIYGYICKCIYIYIYMYLYAYIHRCARMSMSRVNTHALIVYWTSN